MRLNEMNAGYNRLQLQERRIYGGVATKGVRYLLTSCILIILPVLGSGLNSGHKKNEVNKVNALQQRIVMQICLPNLSNGT